MKAPWIFLMLTVLIRAEEDPSPGVPEAHREGSSAVADHQDELSADVQQLAIEQTVPQVIELLKEVEKIMDEATDQLAEGDTGGRTIAAQTEVIEKIHAAAKEKQKQQGGGQSGGAMMDMMERMMGEKPDVDKAGKGNEKGAAPADQGGGGMTGSSNNSNKEGVGETGGKSEERRVPKASGNAGRVLPEEFRKLLDAYNRGAEQRTK